MSRSATAPATPAATAVFTLRLPRPTLQRFREIAEADHRTASQELRRLVDEFIAEAERKAAA